MFNKLGSMVDTLVEKLSKWVKPREENERAGDFPGYPTSRGRYWCHRDRLDRTVLPVLFLPIWDSFF